MARISHQDRVDKLVDHFRQKGYLTLSRKFGKYLPTPEPVGNYEVDAIARYKKKVAIGVTLTENDFDDPKIYSRLAFLSTKYANLSTKTVTLFVGVPQNLMNKARIIISSLDEDAQKRIKLVQIISQS
ncbi:MAG: hypothetical protein KKA84_05955 [Bacteroidetes bacterium]|nr:hypothetical protein [Bacteroidota bacterium]